MYTPDQIKLRTITVEKPSDFGRLPEKVEIGQLYTEDGKYKTAPSGPDVDFSYWRDSKDGLTLHERTIYPNLGYDYVFATEHGTGWACKVLNQMIHGTKGL